MQRKKNRRGAAQRLSRDLEHIATSSILIIGGGGSFGTFAAALQIDGIIMHANTQDFALDGLPHAFKLDSNGHFPCDYSNALTNFANSASMPKWNALRKAPADDDTMVEKSLKAIFMYSKWCEAGQQGKSTNEQFKVCSQINLTVPPYRECGALSECIVMKGVSLRQSAEVGPAPASHQ